MESELRIMPLGDSITHEDGYRSRLYRKLRALGYRFTFVGSDSSFSRQELVAAGAAHHEGHGGWFIKTGGAGEEQWREGIYDHLPVWIPAARPDLILLHIGTNDAADYRSPAQMIADLDSVVTRISSRQAGLAPDAWLLVAQIIPMSPLVYHSQLAGTELNQAVADYNAGVAEVVRGHAGAREKVRLVDQWTGFDPVADLRDGVHPNGFGYEKMATVWAAAIGLIIAPSLEPIGR